MGEETCGRECEGLVFYLQVALVAEPGFLMPGQQAECLQGHRGWWCLHSPGRMPPLGYFCDAWLQSRSRQVGNVVCRRATQSSHFLGPSVKGLGIRVRRDPVRVHVPES